MKNITTSIKNYKQRLICKAKKSGLWENFGQEEVNVLRNEYFDHQYLNDGVWDKILEFSNWCYNYTGE